METNITKSLELRSYYGHKLTQSYRNTFNLLIEKEIDKIIYGYVTTTEKTFIRHSWGVKDKEIIDTTLKREELEKAKYFEVFDIDWHGLNIAMQNTSGPAMVELFPGKEREKRKELKKKYGEILFV